MLAQLLVPLLNRAGLQRLGGQVAVDHRPECRHRPRRNAHGNRILAGADLSADLLARLAGLLLGDEASAVELIANGGH